VGSYGDFAQNDATATSRNVATFIEADGSRVQVVREHSATATTLDNWTITTAGVSSRIAADPNRVGVMMVNNGSARVYLRYDSTIPTSTVFGDYLDPGDRKEIPYWATELAISVAGATAGGNLLTTLFTVS
jgi:hypothetical protein